MKEKRLICKCKSQFCNNNLLKYQSNTISAIQNEQNRLCHNFFLKRTQWRILLWKSSDNRVGTEEECEFSTFAFHESLVVGANSGEMWMMIYRERQITVHKSGKLTTPLWWVHHHFLHSVVDVRIIRGRATAAACGKREHILITSRVLQVLLWNEADINAIITKTGSRCKQAGRTTI